MESDRHRGRRTAAWLSLCAFCGGLMSGGCAHTALLPVMPDSQVTTGEAVLCRLRGREPDEPVFPPLERGMGVDELCALAAKAGAFWARRESGKYRGEYGAGDVNDEAVLLRPGTNAFGRPFLAREMNQTLQFERFAGGRRCMALLVDFVSVRPENSEIAYFRIRPRSLVFNAAKARMTRRLPGFLQADRVHLTVTLTVIFPDGRHPEGLARYSHTFEVRDVRPGEKREFDGETGPSPVSLPFEIASEGPMAVTLRVIESNGVEKKLLRAADALE